MCTQNIKKLFITAFMAFSLGVSAQTIGSWNSSSAQTTTSSAIGVGTINPGAWQEIEYCQNTQIGLIVTKNRNCTQGGGVVASGNSIIWDQLIQPIFVVNGDESYSKFIPVNFRYFPVLTDPSNPYTGAGGISLPRTPIGKPLIWAREKDPSLAGVYGTRFIVTPEGRVGVNMPSPRAALDVRAAYDLNVPVAIFGINNANDYTRHLHMVANLGGGAYNSISQNGDFGLFYTDGRAAEGTNDNGALVIAPWNNQNGAGGLRIDARGNLEVRGDVKATKMTVNARWWPDFVFDNNYTIMSLDSLDAYIKANGHLPGIPSQDSVIANGQDIGEIQKLQQLKIEELTLYIIEQQKLIEEMMAKLNDLSLNTTKKD